jgi:ABC-type transport system involved in multi-copper enzyme maturation permease subunit
MATRSLPDRRPPAAPAPVRDLLVIASVEVFKLRKRWLPWVLQAVGFAVFTIFFWLQFFALFALTRVAGSQAPAAASPRPDLVGLLTLPGGYQNILDTIGFLYLPLGIILGASVVGAEYSWGTVRQMLIKGSPRLHLLLAKLLTVLLFLLIGMAITFLAGVVYALIFSLIAGSLPTAAAVAPDNLGRAAAGFLLQYASRCVYVAVAFAIAVVGRSTVAGLGAGLGYAFVESIASGILGAVYAVTAQNPSAAAARNAALALYRLLVGTNTGALTRLASFRSDSPFQGGFSANGAAIFQPTAFDPPFAALLLIAYVAALLALAFYLFHRRDVAGAIAS